MSVNNMTFEQAATVLNSIRQQVTGVSALAPVNTSDFISVATTTLKAGYDPVLNAITQMIGRTIFSVRPYSRKFKGVQVDNQKYGSITRKIALADKAFTTDDRFTLTDGTSVDMYKVNKPNALEVKFYGQDVYNKEYTIFRDQLDNAFRSPDEFAQFMSMVTQNASDMIEQVHESIARMIIANFVGGKITATNGVIHALTEYNTETGQTLTATTVYDPTNFPGFIKWLYARVATLTSMMTERTGLYQIQVTGKEIMRHTPLDRQKVYMLAPFLNEMNARVLADAYHDDYLKYADVEAVNFWQAALTPDTINVTPSYIDNTGAIVVGSALSQSKIIGVVFDEEALGYTTVHDWSATTPFNVKGGYWNVNHVFTEKWWNDFTEKGAIILLD